MKDKAVYKHGMHGDRSSMGKKGVHRKMGDYFPQQSDYLTEDGRAIDASKPEEQKSEAGEGNINKRGLEGKTTTATNKKGKSVSLNRRTSHRLKGDYIEKVSTDGAGPNYSDPMSPNFNSTGKAPILGSETQYNTKGSSTTSEQKPLAELKYKNKVTFTNKKGKQKSAAGGSKKAKKLAKKYNKIEGKIKKSGYDSQTPTASGKILNYKKGSIEYS
jgi:hypothetical protein